EATAARARGRAARLRGRPRRDRLPLDGRPALEHRERGHLRFGVASEAHAVTDAKRAAEHARVRDLLAAGAALDLEHARGERRTLTARRAREQRCDPARAAPDAGAGAGG